MNKGKQQYTPPVLERYELKYVIDESLVEPMSQYLEAYCTLDKYSSLADDKYYLINSIYLDTPWYLFVRNRMADCHNRFTMRIRGYGENPKPPFFYEIKQKVGNFVRKYRCSIRSDKVYELVNRLHSVNPDDIGEKEWKNFQRFVRLVDIYGAEPKVMVQYKRKAYASDYDEYARVTFDRQLMYAPLDEYTFKYDESLARYYSMAPTEEQANGIVLELKCYATHVPIWMVDLIRVFNLEKTNFSKFVNGIREVRCEYLDPCLVIKSSGEIEDVLSL